VKRRIFSIAILVISLTFFVSFSHPSKVQAAGYFLNFSLAGSASCNTTGTHIPETFVYNLPAGGTSFQETETVNGVVVGNFTGTIPLGGSGSSGGDAGYSFAATGYPYTYTFRLSFNFGASGVYTDTIRLVCNGGTVVSVSVTNGNGSGGSGSGPIFDDGRLNMDALETAAIYCMADGSVRVYVPGEPLWVIAFDASPSEIAKIPTKPDKNTLIKSGKGAFLYRLTTGELQINATSNYVYIFKDCPKPH